MKLVKRLILLGLVIIVAAVVAVSFYVDSIARVGVERGAGYATNVPTTLNSADVQIFSGGFDMEGLLIANPQGFKSSHFLTLGEGSMNVSLGTLMDEIVEVPRLHLTDVDIIIEKTGDKSNLDVIMENIGRLSSTEPADPNAKKYTINEIVIRNVTVAAIMPPLSTAAKPIVVKVPEIRLQDVGSDTSNGVVMSQLTGTIVAATMRAVAENAPDVLGNVVVATIDTALARAGDIGKVGIEVLGEAKRVSAEAVRVVEGVTEEGQKILEGGQRAIENVTGGGDPVEGLRGVGESLDESGKKIEQGIGDALRGLGDLGKKSEESTNE